MSPIFTQCKSDNRPFVKVKLRGTELIALMDTGANFSVLGEKGMKFISQYNLEVKKPSIHCARTADHSKHEVTCVVCLPVTVENRDCMVECLAIPSLKTGLILGADFIVKSKIIIDLANKSFYFKNDTSEINSPIDLSDENVCESEVLSVVGIKNVNDLNEEQIGKLAEIKAEFEKMGQKGLGRTSLIIHKIDTGDCEPIKQRYYALSPFMQARMNEEVDKMLELGVISPSRSAWSSPVLMVKKKSGDYRFVFDGRKLNSVTKHDAYPLPLINNILNKIRDSRFLTSLDLKSSFWQIPLEESSKEKTAFTVPTRGLFQFNVLPFGLHNAAATQQRLMDHLFGPELEPNIFVYLDDIIICSKDFEEHLRLLKVVLEKLKEANLTVNFEKCEFCRSSLKYLGFVVDRDGLRTDPSKVEAMVNFPKPKTATEMKRFVGLCSWYRRFIPQFSTIMAPLSNLIKGKRKTNLLCWNPQAEEAFVEIKHKLVSAPVLASPNFDLPFTVQADASNYGIGGVLTQVLSDGQEHAIAYCSRSLSKCEKNYTIMEKECLALLFAIEQFRGYIEGVHFKAITDNYSLLWLKKLVNPTGRLARWALKLDQYDFTLEHRKGELNVVPDALSRSVPEVSLIAADDDNWYKKKYSQVESRKNVKGWKVENEKLFKYIIPRGRTLMMNEKIWKEVVPESKREEILKICHDSPESAHFGVYKTFHRILSDFYWPNMRRDVKRYIKNCKVCGAQKSTNTLPAGMLGKQKCIHYPFQMISMDLMGPFPRSKSGNCYLFVVTDYFSRFVLAKALRRATTEEILNYVENEVFLKFGVPQIISCDNGSQFISSQFRKMCDEYKVDKIWYNPRYHPQANHTERMNRVIGTAIRSYISDNKHNCWDVNINKIAYAIRAAINESTGHSPNFMVFGRVIPVRGDYYGHVDKDFNLSTSDVEYFNQQLERLPKIYKDAKKRIDKAYLHSAKYYNLRKRNITYRVGDLVWKKNFVLSSAADKFTAKLAPKYVLCKVLRVCSPLIYDLVDENDKSLGKFHISHLKTYEGENLSFENNKSKD